MKCFYHHDRDAVGTCKSCQKGLCPDCAVDFSQGLACKARCEEDVKSLIHLIQTNIKLSPAGANLIRASRRNGMLAAGFPLVLGLMFLGWGLLDQTFFLSTMGAVFVLYGVIALIRVLRITAQQPQP